MTTQPHIMSSNDRLLAMAYVDGELDRTSRTRFEERLRGDPGLRETVLDQRRLTLFIRGVLGAQERRDDRRRIRRRKRRTWARFNDS